MAARLVYIKTVSLLPKQEEEGEQLRRELQGQLLEYSLCKQIAGEMAGMYLGSRVFVRPQARVRVDATYRGNHSPQELLAGYRIVAGKAARRLPPPAAAFSGIVSRRVVSVTSKIVYILKKLYRNTSKRGRAQYSVGCDSAALCERHQEFNDPLYPDL